MKTKVQGIAVETWIGNNEATVEMVFVGTNATVRAEDYITNENKNPGNKLMKYNSFEVDVDIDL